MRSEFDRRNFTPVASTVVSAPRVGEAPAAMECRLLDIQEFGREPSHLIIGEVVHVAIDPAFLKDGILDYTQARPVSRLARIDYLTRANSTPCPAPPNEASF